MASHKIEEIEVSATGMARALGLANSRITQLCEKRVLTKNENNKFNLCEGVHAYIAFCKKGQTRSEANYEKARARKMDAQADLEELKLKKRTGELVEIDTVEDVVKTEYSIVRQRLFTIPNKVTMDMLSCTSATEVQKILMDQLNEALSELKFDTGRVESRGTADELESGDSETGSDSIAP